MERQSILALKAWQNVFSRQNTRGTSVNLYVEMLRGVSLSAVGCSTVFARGALVVFMMFFSDFHHRWGTDAVVTSSDRPL